MALRSGLPSFPGHPFSWEDGQYFIVYWLSSLECSTYPLGIAGNLLIMKGWSVAVNETLKAIESTWYWRLNR
jgi:hypothetical protein